jgi:DNA primase
MFNVIKYYRDYNITISENSKNTQKGWINTTCPFCQDSSDHLGYNLEKGYFSCWICGYHYIDQVIQKLTPYKNSSTLIKEYDTNTMLTTKIKKKINHVNISVKLPGSKLEYCHKKYLEKRGLDPIYIEEKYKLQGTLYNSKYPYRLIIPVYYNNKIVTYQTRGIIEKERYINCEPEKEIIPIKDCLYNIDNCTNNFIVVTEGIFKVFKLGDNSCATFGKNFTNKQIQLLQKYKRIYIYFDNDLAGILGAKKLSSLLDSIGKEVYIISKDIAPDNLSFNQVALFWDKLYDSF